MIARGVVALFAAVVLPSLDPGDLPVCDPALEVPGVAVECVTPQLPEETIGREIGDGAAPAEPAEAAPGEPDYTG